MKLKFAAAALLAAFSMSAFADDQSLNLVADDIVVGEAASFSQSFSSRLDTGLGKALSGGDNTDVLTFDGVASGLYNVSIGISGQFLEWDASSVTLNGQTGTWTETALGKNIRWIGIDTSASAPFTLTLVGTPTAKSFYDGNFSVTSAVPEPTTYGMLLGGLGIMGFLARRKAKKA